jgi:bacillolysin
MKKLLLLVSLIFVNYMHSHAQVDSLFAAMIDTADSNGFVYFKPELLAPGQAFTLYRDYYFDDPNNNMVFQRTRTDNAIFMTHTTYYQTFYGIKVELAQYTEHSLNNYVVYAHGKIVNGLPADPSPTSHMNEASALDSLLIEISVPLDTFAWEDSAMEANIKVETGNPNESYYPQGELLWAIDTYNDDLIDAEIPASFYRLAWKFEVLCLFPSYYRAYYVDAFTGEVFRQVEKDKYDISATLLTIGNRTLDTDYKTLLQAHVLESNDNGTKVHTKFYNSSGSWGGLPEIKHNTNNWGTTDQLATTIHYGVCQAWQFYDDSYNRNGINSVGDWVRVYANSVGIRTKWSEKNGQHYIYGGVDDVSNPLIAIDIAGHEFTHGVIKNEVPDRNDTGEPAAIDEGICDVMGVMTEWYEEGQTINNWTVGEDALSGPQRSLSNPRGMQDPEYYKGDNWDLGGEVHNNGNVVGKWFYMLANGEAKTNEKGHAYGIAKIGEVKAAWILYYTICNKLDDGSGYSDLRQLTIESARLLYGDCSNERIQVENAWFAVGVGGRCPCPPPAILSLNKVKQNDPAQIFPNPASSIVRVSFHTDGMRDFRILSLTGMVVKNLDAAKNNSNYSFDISNLASGIYIMEISENGFIQHVKIVKN